MKKLHQSQIVSKLVVNKLLSTLALYMRNFIVTINVSVNVLKPYFLNLTITS